MFKQVVKRAFDVVCAGFGLLVLAPLGALIALAVKLSDGGPIFFGQTRVGQHGKTFRILKFRSMVVDAHKMGVLVTKDRDPRITRIGRIMRKTKLDELPQLWNVLVGEMSFVGPRPEVPRYVEVYTPEQREILRQKPGITDLASLLFRNEEALLSGAKNVEEFYIQYCLPKKLELNQRYAQRASLLQDVWIILQTLLPFWVGIYALALVATFWFSYQLRSDLPMTGEDYALFRRCLFLILPPQLILVVWRGQLRGLVTDFRTLDRQIFATALAGIMLMQVQGGICYEFFGSLASARSLYLIDLVISFCLLLGVKMALDFAIRHFSPPKPVTVDKSWRVAIVGTGSFAVALARDLTRNARSNRKVVAFFDDNPLNWHRQPLDVPVLGMPECLLKPEWQEKVDEIIVALPDEDSSRSEQVVEMLRATPFKVTVASSVRAPDIRQTLVSAL